MSNVVQLFKESSQKASNEDIASQIIDWAERQGVDITDPVFAIRCTDVVTHLQIIINDSKKV